MELGEESKVSPKRGEAWKVEPGKLLEEGWFFGNLLDRKTRIMSRCYSDPSHSSKVSQEMLVGRSYEETYLSINKVLFPRDDRGRGRDAEVVTTPHQSHIPWPNNLMRTPSMPSHNRNKSSRVQSLKRTPSLPAAMDMDMDNIEDEESNYSMGRLIRQASLGQPHTLPPREQTLMKLIPSSIPKQNNSRKNPEQQVSIQRRRHQVLKHGKNKMALANVEIEQVKDFKRSSDIDSPIMEEEEDSNEIINVRKQYFPEARRLARTTSASPLLGSIGHQRTTDDIMKAQIKLWARAVASNVI